MRRTFLNTHSRRAITIPALTAGWVFATLVFPAVIPTAAILDIILRRRLTVVRALLQAYIFIAVEVMSLARIAFLTLAHRWTSQDRWVAEHERLVGWWARVQMDWARRIFRIRISVEGEESLDGKPFILFIRHVSVMDNLLPAVFAVDRHKASVKWVLNWYLMRDPCIDIVGHRIGCVFVRGSTSQSHREITRIREVAGSLGPGQGLVFYPEGTLYSPEKYVRVLRKVERGRDQEAIEFTRGLRNTLPPRLGGTLALLEHRPDLDVVFCSHSGLEGSLDKASIVGGGLLRKELRMSFWRVPAEEIPRERVQLRRWLFAEWSKVDAFVGDGKKA